MYSQLSFRNHFRFEDRLKESIRLLNKYPDRIPIICERSTTAARDCPIINRTKYLVPRDLTIGDFLYVIRKRLHFPSEKAIFLVVGNTTPSTTSVIYDLYHIYKDADNYLYITYDQENVFG